MGEAIRLTVRPAEAAPASVVVSAIIPLSESEAEPDDLLASLPRDFEIILARGGTRASCMNLAAGTARGRYLWFIHADTVLSAEAVPALLHCIAKEPGGLVYFNLRFDFGGLMRLTELGVWFRSRCLGLPFGDQALCLPAATFRALGGFDEAAISGEDHLLVRKAHGAGVPVSPAGASLVTSARKYRRNGWLRTTWTHLRLTVRQSFPR